MTEHVPHEAEQLDRVAIAPADQLCPTLHEMRVIKVAGVLRLRTRILGSLTDHVARHLGRSLQLSRSETSSQLCGPGTRADAAVGIEHESASVEGLELDEEPALHEEMKRRRGDAPDVDAATEAILRAQLLPASGPTAPRFTTRTVPASTCTTARAEAASVDTMAPVASTSSSERHRAS